MRAVLTALTVSAAAVALSGCADFPELEGTVPAALEQADYPKLVPIEPLLAGADEVQITPDTRSGLAARAAALRARAAHLRRTVVDGGTRARMRAGIDAG